MNPLELEQIRAALPQYDVGGELGRGAFGVVIAAEHRRLGRAAAIKQLPRAFAADPEVRSRFVSEARVLASMNHPHVVPVYDYVEEEGLCLLVMERLTGGTLSESFRGGSIDMQAAIATMLAASSGLHFAHTKGVLHRDVKPDNLMFSSTGILKVTDFGIAKAIDAARTVPTRANDVLGTPAYMAPEQARAAGVSPATDVYALSTVLFELLSGRLPYPEDANALAVLYQHVHEDPTSLRHVAPAVPKAISEVTMKGLARAPEDRYESARAFALALANGATGEWGAGWLRNLNRIAVLDDEIIAATERTARDSVKAHRQPGGVTQTYIGSRVGVAEPVAGSNPPSVLPRPRREVPAPPPPTLMPAAAATELAGGAVVTAPVAPSPTSAPEVPTPLEPAGAPRRSSRILLGVVVAVVVLGALAMSVMALSSSRGGSPSATSLPATTVATATASVEPTLRWRFGAGGPVGSSPAVANGVVYVGTHAKAVLALDAATGEVRWRFATEDIVFSSPQVSNGVVYVGSHDGRLLALDAANGTLKWSATFGAPVQSSPALSPTAVFIGADDGTVAAIDRATGADIWRQTLEGSVFASPAFDGASTVYFATTEGVVTALDVRTGAARWSIHTAPVYSSPAIDGGRLYFGDNDGEVVALDTATGSVVWQFPASDVVGSSPAVADGIVYVGSHDGNVYAIRADTGGEKWRHRVGNVVFSSPTVADAVYVGTHASRVIALNPDDGSVEWEFKTDGIVGSSPTVADGSLYVGSDDGNVYALELPTSP